MLPETLRAGDELYRALLELSAEAIARFALVPPVRVDRPADEQVDSILTQARVAECNDAYAALYGRSTSETVGLSLHDLGGGERRAAVARFVRGRYRITDSEVTHDLPDGSARWVSGSALGLVDGALLHGYWVALHDITARRRAEAEQDRRDRILEAVAFGAARLLETGAWTSHADAVLGRLGEAVGAARAWIAEVVGEGDGPPLLFFRATWGVPGLEVAVGDPRIRLGVPLRGDLAPIADAMRAGRPVVAPVTAFGEESVPARLGSKTFAAVPITIAGTWWGVLGFGETRYDREWSGPELEALKVAAAVFAAAVERDRAERALRRARTLEAMGSLVAGVAHEVRNPLFSISATVDALEADVGLRPEFTEYASLLRSQVGRLSQLMRDLLEYGKPSVLQRGVTRLAEVVRRAVRSCAPLAQEHQVRVEEEVDGDIPALLVEGARVEQALENLLANGIQHSPAGSVVRIHATLDASAVAPEVRCTVDDEGPGIPASDLEQLFEPFFSRRKGGTGLGLPIVQRVAEAHGGRVTAESRPGGGARFTLILPVSAPEGAPGV